MNFFLQAMKGLLAFKYHGNELQKHRTKWVSSYLTVIQTAT